jgi:hypothetical protein
MKCWLITRHEKGGMEVLTLDPDDGGCSGEEALPVFSSEEEAKIFLRFEVSGNGGWRARESPTGALALVLLGVCAGVERVALGPLLPIGGAGEATVLAS